METIFSILIFGDLYFEATNLKVQYDVPLVGGKQLHGNNLVIEVVHGKTDYKEVIEVRGCRTDHTGVENEVGVGGTDHTGW